MTYLQSNMDLLTRYELTPNSVLAAAKISPLVKWPGGKTGELSLILPEVPLLINRYFEPFLGGGAVFFSIDEQIPAFVNDKSADLMDFYSCVRDANSDFFVGLKQIKLTWMFLEAFVDQYKNVLIEISEQYTKGQLSADALANDVGLFIINNKERLINNLGSAFNCNPEKFIDEINRNLIGKIVRTRNIQDEYGRFSADEVLKNLEGAVKSGYYMYIRDLYNYCSKYGIRKEYRAVIFFFIREYSYASMFRFNSKGHFNVPYGGITYNRKDLSGKVAAMSQQALIKRLGNSCLENMDFLSFLHKHKVAKDDFIFLDPPYDTEFSSYDQNSFTKIDQSRLASYLIDECEARFLLVIKYTEYIGSLYENKGLNIKYFDKKYLWTIKERNARDTIHVMIKNY